MSATPSPFLAILLAALLAELGAAGQAFEGRINASVLQGRQATPLLYTAGTNLLRIEVATNQPNTVDIVELQTAALTLLFPQNSSFVRLKAADEDPGKLALPPGADRAYPTAPGVPPVPAMPMMPRPGEKLDLKKTGEETNILGLACARYEIKQRGETLEVWATQQLFPYQPYVKGQTPRFGPARFEERWPRLLAARKLFPLLATLRNSNGKEHFRFEVQSITPEKLTDAAKLFQPPPGYVEVRPLPF